MKCTTISVVLYLGGAGSGYLKTWLMATDAADCKMTVRMLQVVLGMLAELRVLAIVDNCAAKSNIILENIDYCLHTMKEISDYSNPRTLTFLIS